MCIILKDIPLIYKCEIRKKIEPGACIQKTNLSKELFWIKKHLGGLYITQVFFCIEFNQITTYNVEDLNGNVLVEKFFPCPHFILLRMVL